MGGVGRGAFFEFLGEGEGDDGVDEGDFSGDEFAFIALKVSDEMPVESERYEIM